MAKKKAKKKQGHRTGKVRTVPRAVAVYAGLGLRSVRLAKAKLEKLAPKSRKAWAELHHVESRLSRLV